jgi:alpha-glucosidase (family GH31 glycosyl hydrolase)
VRKKVYGMTIMNTRSPHDDWQLALETDLVEQDENVGKEMGFWGCAMHCELMAKSPHDAVVDLVPDERPFVLTRSATAGTMRYAASSWGGDNVTSWDGMQGANFLSLNVGISLLQLGTRLHFPTIF